MDDFDEVIENRSDTSKPSSPKKVIYKTFDEDEVIHLVRRSKVEGYGDFTEELYPHSLNFYDFEVFMGDWMVVIINPIRKTRMIIVNDSDALKSYHNRYCNEIWIGYNSRSYDAFILKAILLGLNPKIVNDEIIVKGNSGWSISKDFSDIQLYNFDIMNKYVSLKQLEAFMGNDIRETSVPFDIDRPLTQEEIEETIKYCVHDVEQTIEVFRRRKSDFDAHMDLINTFNLPLSMINLTQAQLTANILGCNKVERDNDEFDLEFVKTIRLKKYRKVLDWFNNPRNHNYGKDNRLVTNVCGVPHTFAWGGVHGCPDKPLYRKGRIYHVDVTSYYPSIMIEYDFLTRNCGKNKQKFKQIYDKRVELKRAGKKKEQAPYKIILNGTYGICKDKYSKAYDPRQANNVCVNGQLMLLDLLEHLEGYADIIQSNTDGIILQVEDNDKAVEKMKAICQEWMDRTKMGLGFDEIEWIYQKDVNNYCFKFTNGKYERKGAYVKELDELDNDLPIVNEALVNYFIKGESPEDTINSCNDLIKFQKVVKISSNYKMAWHNGEYLKDKTFRVFASKNLKDTYMGKIKENSSTIEKFGDTPSRCFIDNGDIKDKKVDSNLDKKWYIDLAYKRLDDFGVSLKEDNMLF